MFDLGGLVARFKDDERFRKEFKDAKDAKDAVGWFWGYFSF
jgi:hypothetical protein